MFFFIELRTFLPFPVSMVAVGEGPEGHAAPPSQKEENPAGQAKKVKVCIRHWVFQMAAAVYVILLINLEFFTEECL